MERATKPYPYLERRRERESDDVNMDKARFRTHHFNNILVQPRIRRCVSPTFLLFVFLSGCLLCWYDIVTLRSSMVIRNRGPDVSKSIEHSLDCTTFGFSSRPDESELARVKSGSCPEYFRWIHEDLRPWKKDGISRELMEKARDYADFRLVILKGKVYVEKFAEVYQTRDIFTVWGILQLLRLYPGRIPDLELMFSCDDKPRITKLGYQEGNVTSLPPPMFQYCEDDSTMGVLFPDWTFWGWSETKIRPWKGLMESLKEGNRRTKWKDREPFAFWRGNPDVTLNRLDLMQCNASEGHDWNARLYRQDWDREARTGFRSSKLEDQCTHRYKIYIEGRGWSVSEKYILACDSMVLLVEPQFSDFFSRTMMPLQQYWPIRIDNKCRDIKFAVEWGNNHTDQAEAIGKAGSRFVLENLRMENVYDYMFHALNEYAELLNFKPKLPEDAMEVHSEALANAWIWSKYLTETKVSPVDSLPCTLPPPYEADEFRTLLQQKECASKQVQKWQDEHERKQITKNFSDATVRISARKHSESRLV